MMMRILLKELRGMVKQQMITSQGLMVLNDSCLLGMSCGLEWRIIATARLWLAGTELEEILQLSFSPAFNLPVLPIGHPNRKPKSKGVWVTLSIENSLLRLSNQYWRVNLAGERIRNIQPTQD